MRILILFIYSLGVFSFNFHAYAQDQLLEYVEEVAVTGEDVVEARQNATQQAVERVSLKLIQEMLGDVKLDRQLSALKAKVLPESEKYISFIKTETPRKVGNENRVSVTLKVSPRNLQALLQQTGFMANQSGPGVLLPVVSFSDLVNRKTLKWWMEAPESLNPFLKSQERVMAAALNAQFVKIEFKTLDPQSWQYRKQVPPRLHLESLRTQDYPALGDHFKAQLVVKGDVRFETTDVSQIFKVVARFVVLHSANGRVIADTVKAVETEPGAFSTVVPKAFQGLLDESLQDLALQVSDAWKKGSITATPVNLVVKGQLDHQQVENLKQEIRSSFRSVRSITERLFTSSQIIFEVDVDGGLDGLSRSFQSQRFKTVPLKFKEVKDGAIVLQ